MESDPIDPNTYYLMKCRDGEMRIEQMEGRIKNLDSVIDSVNKNQDWLDRKGQKGDGKWLYTLDDEERNRLRSMTGSGGAIATTLQNTRAELIDLLNSEKELQREYSQQVKLDRTTKINSFVLRISTALGIIFASSIALTVATHYGFYVPWIVSRNITATGLASTAAQQTVPSEARRMKGAQDEIHIGPNETKEGTHSKQLNSDAHGR